MGTESEIIINKCDRKATGHKIGDSRKPRERTLCPKCDSMNVRKRVTMGDYKCDRCGWVGERIIRRVV